MGLPNSVVNDKIGNPYASTIYLIISDDISGLAKPEQTKEQFFSALSAITINSEYTATDGKASGIMNIIVSDDDIVAGVNVASLIVSEENGKGYFKYLSSAAAPFNDGAADRDIQTTTTSWRNLGTTATWIQGYTVPEPATGALALAGLALLFRRKRA